VSLSGGRGADRREHRQATGRQRLQLSGRRGGSKSWARTIALRHMYLRTAHTRHSGTPSIRTHTQHSFALRKISGTRRRMRAGDEKGDKDGWISEIPGERLQASWRRETNIASSSKLSLAQHLAEGHQKYQWRPKASKAYSYRRTVALSWRRKRRNIGNSKAYPQYR